MTYPSPTMQTSAGFLSCNYSDPTTSADLVIVVSSVPGSTASTLQAVAQSQAQAQHVTASSVSGLGDAAFIITLDDAGTNALHVATTIVMALKGSIIYDVTAEATPDQVKAVVQLLLGQ
jgi:hypothetical protein